MKRRTDAQLRIAVGVIGIGMVIGQFGALYGSFFMFGAAITSLLYGLTGMIRSSPRGKKK